MDRLVAALAARVRQFAEARDSSAVLDPMALDEARQLREVAFPAGGNVEAVPVAVLVVLAHLHWSRYIALPAGRDQDDLRSALGFFVLLWDRAPELIPGQIRDRLAALPGHAGDADSRGEEGTRAFSEYHRTGSLEALGNAVRAFEDAVAATALGHPDRAMYLSNLCGALLRRFERAGDAGDLDAAIDAGRRAVEATSPGHPNLAGRWSNLGAVLLRRFQRAGNAGDLDAAIDAGRRAVEATSPGHPEEAMRWSNLGAALRNRFESAGDAGDLDAAIDAGRRAVDAATPDRADLSMCLGNLANSLFARFEQAGDAADLDAAIDAGRQAVEATSPGHPDLAGRLSILGAALRARFERAGEAGDLDAAVEAGRRAVDAVLPGNPDLGAMLSNLGATLRARFALAGDAGDLDAAVEAVRQAVEATPVGRPQLAGHLTNLAAAHLARFERAGDAPDLDAAVEAGRRAVDAALLGNPDLGAMLSNLGVSLLTRYERTRDARDVNAAVEAARRAVEAVHPDHPHHAGYLSNLADSLVSRFRQTGSAGDLDGAVEAGRCAVEETSPGHPDLVAELSVLGSALRARFDQTGEPADLGAAIDCWKRASQVPAGPPQLRLAAARTLGSVAARAGLTHEAAEGYRVAVEVLPQVAWHGLDRRTRAAHLARLAGLAADAAACAIIDGCPELGVELLEQGRSLLWNQALNLRGDMRRLAEQAPDLARRIDSIRQVLDPPLTETRFLREQPGGTGSAAGHLRHQQDAVELRRRMAREWDDVLVQVRNLDGFEHFLKASPYTELAAATGSDPVVIVNASRYGCHALLCDASHDNARVVALPGLSWDSAVSQVNTLLRVLYDASDPRQSRESRLNDRLSMLDLLSWLWDVIAEPVLAALGHMHGPNSTDLWPQVRWCPTGPLALLPIHAAGHHPRPGTNGAPGGDCVPDRVISSYTPTITALARTQQPVMRNPARQLTVGMPATPALPPLPAVPRELSIIERYFPPGEANLQLTGQNALTTSVLAAMTSHSWVHLACHAQQDQAEPDLSGFALWDGTLTISDLASQPTRQRDLAFLSACQTAAGSIRHLDEAIHLAAALQFLGYRHVIATMWTIADTPAPKVADIVYGELTRNGQPDLAKSAHALHHAIQCLRHDNRTNDPFIWAPYIHLGN